MSAGTFQVPVPHPAQLAGRIDARLIDPGGNPPEIIKGADDLDVEFTWEVTGSLVPLIAGSWQLRVNVDQLGGPLDKALPEMGPENVAVTPNSGNYTRTVRIPAGFMSPGPTTATPTVSWPR